MLKKKLLLKPTGRRSLKYLEENGEIACSHLYISFAKMVSSHCFISNFIRIQLLNVRMSAVSGIVRQASLQVWKAIVSNTPRILKEILPVMMTMVIRNVASSSYDRRTVAARTLGDLVRKLGESILSEIIPILEDGLDSSEANTRQGVSIALSEIMATAGRVQVNDYVDNIIPAVRKALCDSSSDVREAAAQGLYHIIKEFFRRHLRYS